MLLGDSPNPSYAHNYGLGESLNYVDPSWTTYTTAHKLEYHKMRKYLHFGKMTHTFTCSCGMYGRAFKLQDAIEDLWKRHRKVENVIHDSIEQIRNTVWLLREENEQHTRATAKHGGPNMTPVWPLPQPKKDERG